MIEDIKVKWLSVPRKVVDPKDMPLGTIELWSIPDFDNGAPSYVTRDSIGSSKKEVFPGDVLLSKIVPHIRRAWVVKPSSYPQYASTEWMIFRSEKVIPEYLQLALTSDEFNAGMLKNTNGMGSLKRADPEKVGCQKIPLPLLQKQKEVVSKARGKITKLSELISMETKILGLVNSYRQSLISRAVTKGIDPAVPMKDSGIPWIGKIPAHWKMGKLANVGKFLAGSAFPEAFQGERNNQVPFYKVADLSQSYDDWHMNDSANTITPQQVVQLKASIIPPDCIVYAKIGAAMLLNKRRITVKNCCIDNNMTAFKPTGINIDWAYFWLSFIDFGIFSFPATVPSLSEGRQGRIPILIPPQNEQEEIATFIKKKINSIHTISKNVSQTIDLLKEFRASLVSNILEEGLEFNRNLAVASTEVCDE